MTDNKTKRGHPDSDLFNKKEDYEVQYAINELSKEFDNSKAEIKKSLLESAEIKNFHENRKMIMNSTRLKLKNLK